MKSSNKIISKSWLNTQSGEITPCSYRDGRKKTSNNQLKRWMVGVSLLVITSLQVNAQHVKRAQIGPEEKARKVTEKMASELQLSDVQKSQLLELNLAQAKKREAEIEKERERTSARSEEMKAYQESMKQILTEEQRSKWEELKLEQRSKRRPGGEIHRSSDLPRPKRGN